MTHEESRQDAQRERVDKSVLGLVRLVIETWSGTVRRKEVDKQMFCRNLIEMSYKTTPLSYTLITKSVDIACLKHFLSME